MSQYKKLLLSVLSGAKDQDISFSDLQLVLERLGFQRKSNPKELQCESPAIRRGFQLIENHLIVLPFHCCGSPLRVFLSKPNQRRPFHIH